MGGGLKLNLRRTIFDNRYNIDTLYGGLLYYFCINSFLADVSGRTDIFRGVFPLGTIRRNLTRNYFSFRQKPIRFLRSIPTHRRSKYPNNREQLRSIQRRHQSKKCDYCIRRNVYSYSDDSAQRSCSLIRIQRSLTRTLTYSPTTKMFVETD